MPCLRAAPAPKPIYFHNRDLHSEERIRFSPPFTEGADYTKKSVESRLALGEKLLGAKSFETVIQIQTEYAKTAYADFVAQATKMGELHSNLAKAAFKPAELTIAKMQTGQFPFIQSAR